MPPEETLRIERLACAALALVVLCGAPVMAQEYPNKPVRIVVGFAAGSVSDLTARALAQKLGSALGQPFVVEVRPGAGSNVAAQYVVRSPKDGYTLFVATSSSTLRSPSSASLGFDFATDLYANRADRQRALRANRLSRACCDYRAGVHLARQVQARDTDVRRNRGGYHGLSGGAVVQSASRHQAPDRFLSKYRAGNHRLDDRAYLDRIRVRSKRPPVDS